MSEEFEGRLDLLQDILDHYKDRIEALEDSLQSKEDDHRYLKSYKLEWFVIILFIVEVIEGAFQYLHHV